MAALGVTVTVISQSPDAELRFDSQDGVRIVYLPKWQNDSFLSWRLKQLEAMFLGTRFGG